MPGGHAQHVQRWWEPRRCKGGVRSMRRDGKSPWGCREGVRILRNGGGSPRRCREGVRILRRHSGSQGDAGRTCAACAMVAGARENAERACASCADMVGATEMQGGRAHLAQWWQEPWEMQGGRATCAEGLGWGVEISFRGFQGALMVLGCSAQLAGRLEGQGMTCAACRRVQGARGWRKDAVRRLRTGARVEGWGARFAGGCTEYRGWRDGVRRLGACVGRPEGGGMRCAFCRRVQGVRRVMDCFMCTARIL